MHQSAIASRPSYPSQPSQPAIKPSQPVMSSPGVPAGAPAPGEPVAGDLESLVFQRCTWCGTTSYQRLLCPVCAGSDMRLERSAGVGTVRHSTVVNRNTPAARNVSLVEMSEGFVVRGRVMGLPGGVQSGDRVRLTTARDTVRGEPVFQPVDEPWRAWN